MKSIDIYINNIWNKLINCVYTAIIVCITNARSYSRIQKSDNRDYWLTSNNTYFSAIRLVLMIKREIKFGIKLENDQFRECSPWKRKDPTLIKANFVNSDNNK